MYIIDRMFVECLFTPCVSKFTCNHLKQRKKVQKVTDIQIVIRLTGWMPYKDIKLLTLEKKKIHSHNKRSKLQQIPYFILM